MKRILAVIIACFMLACLTACSDNDEWIVRGDDENIPSEESVKEPQTEQEKTPEQNSEQAKKETREEIKALADEALKELEKTPEYPEGFPTLDDVVAQYQKANEAIGWIINTEAIATNPQDIHKAHGFEYQRVLPDCQYGADAGKNEDNKKLIYNRETLEAYIATLIHPDEASDYMIDLKEGYEVPRITAASNGALYALTYSYTPEGYGDKDEYELVDNGDGSYTFAVTYTTLNDDGSEHGKFTQNFGYEKVDGRWVLTNFRVIKQ